MLAVAITHPPPGTHTIDEQRHSYQRAQLLAEFWRRAQRARSRAERLGLLQDWAARVLTPDPYTPHDPARVRRHMTQQIVRGHYRLTGWCWVCRAARADHRHHIVTVRHGGANRKLNLVNLCLDCHSAVHGFPVGYSR